MSEDTVSKPSNQSTAKQTSVIEPDRVKKSLIIASKTPLWIDIVTGIGLVGVLVANSAGWNWAARSFFVALLILALIGQTQFSGAAATRSNWFLAASVIGAVLAFAVGIALVPQIIFVYQSSWWVFAVFMLCTFISVVIFRGLRWVLMWIAQQREERHTQGGAGKAEESSAPDRKSIIKPSKSTRRADRKHPSRRELREQKESTEEH